MQGEPIVHWLTRRRSHVVTDPVRRCLL